MSSGSAPTVSTGFPEINVAVVLDAILSSAEQWKIAFHHLTALIRKLQDLTGSTDKAHINVAFVSYGAADMTPTPIFCYRTFVPLGEIQKMAIPTMLGSDQMPINPKGGMAVLEALVAVLELCDSYQEPAQLENVSLLHRGIPPRSPKSRVHILLCAAAPPDDATAPRWNSNAAFDDLNWDGLAEEIKKRDIGLNMLLTKPNAQLAAFHKAVVLNASPAWYPAAAGHSLYFEQLPTKITQPANIQPKVLQENKRPSDDALPDPKRFKASTPMTPPIKAEALVTAGSQPLDPQAVHLWKNEDLIREFNRLQAALQAMREVAKKATEERRSEDEMKKYRDDLRLTMGMFQKIYLAVQARGITPRDLHMGISGPTGSNPVDQIAGPSREPSTATDSSSGFSASPILGGQIVPPGMRESIPQNATSATQSPILGTEATTARAMVLQQQKTLTNVLSVPGGVEQVKRLIGQRPDLKGTLEQLLAQRERLAAGAGGGPASTQQTFPPTGSSAPHQPTQNQHAQASLKPVWQGTVTWSMQNAAPRIVPVIAQTPRGDLRFDLWPSQLFLTPQRRTYTKEELASWTQRHHPPLCLLQIAPEAANTDDENRLRELIILLATKHAIAIVDIPGSGTASGSGSHLVVFSLDSRLAIAAVIDKPVPELLDGAPSAIQAGTSTNAAPLTTNVPNDMQSRLAQVLSALPPETKQHIMNMPEHMRLPALQAVYLKRMQAQQQALQGQGSSSIPMHLRPGVGAPNIQPPFIPQQTTFGQPAPTNTVQPAPFGGQPHLQPGNMTLPNGFQPWQRPPGQ